MVNSVTAGTVRGHRAPFNYGEGLRAASLYDARNAPRTQAAQQQLFEAMRGELRPLYLSASMFRRVG